jgi:hypothetical protein
MDRWDGQPNYAELWVEKQALAGVLQPLSNEYHCTLMVNKGYSSASAMYDAGKRFEYRMHGRKGDAILFYLGDFDPSGEDMVRDIRERIHMFSGLDVQVRKLALNLDQIEEYEPPPNPAKMSDSRAAAFVAKYGASSWEVDALPPKVLTSIIHDAFNNVIDGKKMRAVKDQEELDKKALRSYSNALADDGWLEEIKERMSDEGSFSPREMHEVLTRAGLIAED